jgi:hypothetical protein
MAVGICVDCGKDTHVEEFDAQGEPEAGGEWLCLPCSYYRKDCHDSQFAPSPAEREAAKVRVLKAIRSS